MPRKCLVINLDRCTGCDSCIVSCKFENHLPLGTFYNRVMQVGPTGSYPNVERYNLPVQCQQCTHARCVEVCPTGASYRDSESGIVLVDESKCIGCQYCVMACPYGVRAYDEGKEREGYQDVANIKEDIVQRACTAPYFGGAFTILKPIAWALQQDDTAPYYYGAVTMNCTAPAMTQDTELEGLL